MQRWLPGLMMCGIGWFKFALVVGGQPSSLSLTTDGNLVWANPYGSGITTIEWRTNLQSSAWLPLRNLTMTGDTQQLWVGLKGRTGFYRMMQADSSFNPPGMRLIPQGRFLMGDTFSEGGSNERPPHVVFVSSFYMDTFEVTQEYMRAVLQWAFDLGKITVNSSLQVYNTEGQKFLLVQLFTARDPNRSHLDLNFVDGQFFVANDRGNYPCPNVSWYGAAAYCNFRSEIEGLEKCFNPADWSCDFARNGYRLPTETEWEKAARGGLTANHFPWDSAGTLWYLPIQVDPSKATYTTVGQPHPFHTTPVGYFNGSQVPEGVDMANGYGLYDMAGNLREWCWDWYQDDAYTLPEATQDDPKGPPTGTTRLSRGGSFDSHEKDLRCSFRGNPMQSPPSFANWYHGFRCVRRP